jgi:LysM repeat protein
VDEIITRMTDRKTRILYAVVTVLFLLFVFSTVLILYHLSGRLTEMKNHVASIEKKTVDLEKRQTEDHGLLTKLEGKLTALSNSPAMKEVETLVPRVNLLEKQLVSTHVRQKVTTVRSQPVHKKRYYEVKEGDSLYQISKKFGLSVEELIRMNDLDEKDLSVMVGERLVVSK